MTQEPTPQAPETPDQPAEGTILELAAAAVLDGLEFTPDRVTFGATRVGPDVADLVGEHGAVVVCRQVGGLRQSLQTTARLAVEVYAGSYTDMWAAQAALERHLTLPLVPTPAGALRIDSWRNESAATESMHPPLYVLVSAWRITSRAL